MVQIQKSFTKPKTKNYIEWSFNWNYLIFILNI
jgi:hypothetical protein